MMFKGICAAYKVASLIALDLICLFSSESLGNLYPSIILLNELASSSTRDNNFSLSWLIS